MQENSTLADALAMMRDLRARCDWDRAQTHESLRPYLIEEAHELDDAIRAGDVDAMREELGDVLLQVLFHAVIAEERAAFDAGDVAATLIDKMHRRHPHLFGGGERQEWETLKGTSRRSITDGLPPGLPALHRAQRLQERAAAIGFDWPDIEGPLAKVSEELAEVRAELGEAPGAGAGPAASSASDDTTPPQPVVDRARLDAELGDLLFAVVNLCRKAGAHPALVLDSATARFAARVATVERLAAERHIDLRAASLESLDVLWEEAKGRQSVR